MTSKINHKVTGWDKGYYHKVYQIFCTLHGGNVPATYALHKKGYECGGCNKNINNVVNQFEGGR